MPEASPLNDPTIPNDELLYHRVYPEPLRIYIDPVSREPRPTSGDFHSKDHEPLSVDLASLTTPEESLSRAPGFYLSAVQAGDVRDPACGCGIVRDPEPENRAHALIYGRGKGGALTKGQREKVAKQARFIVVDEHAVQEARERAAREED
jgi:hypothetical protein